MQEAQLRNMQIKRSDWTVAAGGGLSADSVFLSEASPVELRLQTVTVFLAFAPKEI